MHIIDTHLHLIYPQQLRYPWIVGSALERAFVLEDYTRLARDYDINSALYMEVDVAPDDIAAEIALLQKLAIQPECILAGQIANCRPEHNDFTQQLQRLHQASEISGTSGKSEIKGVRRILHTSDDSLSKTPLFVANLRQLTAFDYSFDLCVLARQLQSVALPLVQQCPEVRFVLDHCGVPAIKESTTQTFAEWKNAITELARYPNLNCKLSGLVAYADAQWDINTLRPYAEHVINSFGWDRVVWGSDWPVCTLGGGLQVWIEATHALLHACSEEQQAKLLHRNAQRIYRLQTPH